MEEGKNCYKYLHPAVTTDGVVFGFDGKRLNILLIKRGAEPFKGCWAFHGGFMNIEETAEQGAMRELCEETVLKLEYLKQFGTFSAVHRDPRERVITIAFYALARKSDVQGGGAYISTAAISTRSCFRPAFWKNRMKRLRKADHAITETTARCKP